MQEFSSVYADFTLNTRYENLEKDVIQQAKMVILDLVGVSLAGYKLMEFPRIVLDYTASLGGAPEATIIQMKKKFPAINAAFANGACAHALDMDDGHRFSALHPGTVVIPAAIAAAELSGASTRQLIAGIVAGYEVMIRVGMAINPSSLDRGFHLTGVSGPFGAVASAGNIMGLSREELVGAFGLAGLQASGLTQVTQDAEGVKVKPINPARAAQSGLLSTVLAKKGARGPMAILEGDLGFLKAVADEVKTDLLTRDLGRKFEIRNVYLKRWAACRHTHAAIDAALEAFEKAHISTDEISKITVETYPIAVKIVGIENPTTPSAGRFSIPFSVALALIRQDAGADKYTEENIGDESIQDLASKVTFSVSSKWEKPYPEKRGASVKITGKNNKTWSAEVELAKGEPENPASWDEIYGKFYRNATLLISEKEAKVLGDAIANLDDLQLDEFTKLI